MMMVMMMMMAATFFFVFSIQLSRKKLINYFDLERERDLDFDTLLEAAFSLFISIIKKLLNFSELSYYLYHASVMFGSI